MIQIDQASDEHLELRRAAVRGVDVFEYALVCEELHRRADEYRRRIAYKVLNRVAWRAEQKLRRVLNSRHEKSDLADWANAVATLVALRDQQKPKVYPQPAILVAPELHLIGVETKALIAAMNDSLSDVFGPRASEIRTELRDALIRNLLKIQAYNLIRGVANFIPLGL